MATDYKFGVDDCSIAAETLWILTIISSVAAATAPDLSAVSRAVDDNRWETVAKSPEEEVRRLTPLMMSRIIEPSWSIIELSDVAPTLELVEKAFLKVGNDEGFAQAQQFRGMITED